jgi:MFS family permease
VSGALADRLEPRSVAAIGLGLILAGIIVYAGLGTGAAALSVAFALMLIGAGTGFFIPANQKAAFATVASEDYGILAAMLSSFGTAASTLGTTLTVALIETVMAEHNGDGAGFAGAQRFAFSMLVPLAGAALVIALIGRKLPQKGSRVENDGGGADYHA